MRFSARSKVGVLLSLVTILTLVSAFAVAIVSRGSATHASTGNTPQVSQLQTFTTRSITAPGSTGIRNPATLSPVKNLPTRNMGTRTSVRPSQASSRVNSASASSSLTDQVPGSVLHKFSGLSNLDNAKLNPFTVEPPDQGICAGYLKDQATGQNIPMEYEMVNDVIAIYLPNGNLVVEQSLQTFFGEANFSNSSSLLVGDPRCHFDSLTHTFFFSVTVIGQDQFLPPSSLSHIDLAAIDANTQTGIEILVDTTDTANSNCPCYADYPTFGLDNNAVYVAYNEFPITGSAGFQAAHLFVFSKNQLVNQAHVVNGFGFTFSPEISSLQPAINVSPANSEYLENSFLSTSGSNVLALWHVTNDQGIARDVPPVVNPAKLITVQAYFPPVAATSTGNGSITGVFTSATTLDAGDNRMQQVEGIQDEGQIELWSSLDTAVSLKGDSHTRDGIAWFRINPANASVVEQGTLGSPGNYMLYPAILHSNNGTTAIVFSITSATLNPSAAYVLSPSSPTNFGSTLKIVALGANPYLTEFNRWGDYSAAALAPNGNNIWLATEYVPPTGATTFGANWGTQVFEVSNND
jgi:hypothetical protein